MKPKNAKKKIDKIFDGYLNKEYDIYRTAVKLDYARPELHKMLKIASKHDDDSRSGQETYGFRHWETDLEYISDRWNARFRIQWMIDLIDYLKEKYEKK